MGRELVSFILGHTYVTSSWSALFIIHRSLQVFGLSVCRNFANCGHLAGWFAIFFNVGRSERYLFLSDGKKSEGFSEKDALFRLSPLRHRFSTKKKVRDKFVGGTNVGFRIFSAFLYRVMVY